MPLRESAIVRSRQLRILVRGVNWIGDAVMTMPAVQRLREFEPNAHLAMLCPAKLKDLWLHNPFLNEVLTFEDRADVRELRDHAFDVAVIFPNSFRSAWECWRARIPCRVGFAGHRRRWLLTDVVRQSRDEQPSYKVVSVAGKSFQVKSFAALRHQTRRYLDIISYIGGKRDFTPPRIWFAVEEMPLMTRFFREDGRPLLAIHAGAEYGPAKRWFPERFAEVALRVTSETDCKWALVGAAADAAPAAVIEQYIRARSDDPDIVTNLVGKTSLVDLIAILKYVRALLTNDSGPMHMASALATPVVALFGSTSPELTGPTGQRCVVIRQPVECSPCFLRECPIDFRCMDRVTPEEVTDAVMKML
jgi:heptosyltransferase-2